MTEKRAIMSDLSEYFVKTFSINTDSKTQDSCVICSHDVRISVLSSRLVRVEKGKFFTDEATQTVLNRNFDKPKFVADVSNDFLIITTDDCIFQYSIKSDKMLSITLKNIGEVTDFKKGNLKGTTRTLDATFGAVALQDGLISRNGVSIIDDKDSLILQKDGTISVRKKCHKDEYYFAYGNEYRECLKDFYKLTGTAPLVPRYCLGNWWSRYKAYSQDEYITLMKRFIDEKIPITVATIDMDWHWVDIIDRFGKEAKYKRETLIPKTIYEIVNSQGWTGYSWNTELFPNYKELLKWLQKKNFKVTLNLHPAQGVRFYENQYPQMAQAMGIDPSSKKQVSFDISNAKFIDAYFNILHKPYENQGVDFWWIDWQQGKNAKVKNLDPLWALNHYHTMASDTTQSRPLILSRYAGVGSHRYPLGFSGDTAVNWKCLDFQPYFTATAANIGYTWWSHDIGGHNFGVKDDELYVRWVQFGAYSPVNRLHSSNNEFMGKEPWKHDYQAQSIATDFLRQRHSLIPYIYSMNYQTHQNARALCEPMYYEYPAIEAAYEVPNQYFFGSELIAAPITKKANEITKLAYSEVWLPNGRWTDIYTGAIYQGNQKLNMYRDLHCFPVLAKEGAIIPLAANNKTNDCSNPLKMKIKIYRGNNEFDLYEDDGISNEFKHNKCALTKFKVFEKDGDLVFRINNVLGDLDSTAKYRDYELCFEDIAYCKSILATVNISPTEFDWNISDKNVSVQLKDITGLDKVEVRLIGVVGKKNYDLKQELIELITKYQLPVKKKKTVYDDFVKNPSVDSIPVKQKALCEPLLECFRKLR